jgi:hypothetical protein
MHKSQMRESSSMLFLPIISLVLNLSLSNNQKKTLRFIWHLDLQIHRYTGWVEPSRFCTPCLWKRRCFPSYRSIGHYPKWPLCS